MSAIRSVIPAPAINVTPLIDVLLVLLIIFMVAAPLKPHRFLAKLPAPPTNINVNPGPHTLVVTIEPDRTLKLNHESDMGTVDNLVPLTLRLMSVFEQRTRNRAYRPDRQEIEKTVFIKAPRSIPYGEVVRVLDGLKVTGADPIGLQLDDLRY